MSEDIIYCPQCGGTGFTDEEHEPPCDYCQGTGEVPQSWADDYSARPQETLYYPWETGGKIIEGTGETIDS